MNSRITGEGDVVVVAAVQKTSLQFLPKTFEHRNENKNCSACPENQLKPFYFLNFEFKFSNFQFFSRFLVSSFRV